jgi:hypothetical protein
LQGDPGAESGEDGAASALLLEFVMQQMFDRWFCS